MRSTHSQIVDITSIQEMVGYIKEDAWLLTDLDNTINEPHIVCDHPVSVLGTDQWFSAIMQYACELILDTKEAAETVIAIYNELQKYTQMKPVEDQIVDVINHYQKKIPIIGLTARGIELKPDTLRQLKEIGIDLNEIIFCTGKNKGLCFKEYLKTFESIPQYIVMIDDKRKNLEEVEKITLEMGIQFIGLRYGFLDEKVKNIDMAIAKIELTQIKHYLSNPTQNLVEKLNICSVGMFRPKIKKDCEEKNKRTDTKIATRRLSYSKIV